MKISIDDNLKGKDLFSFLKEHKEKLIAQKRAIPIKYGFAVDNSPTIFTLKEGAATKATFAELEETATSLRVKIVGNTAYWCDNDMDVLIADCWKKTIKDRKDLIKHLRDHVYQLDAEVGDPVNIYSQDISLLELGINMAGTTQALIMESDVQKSYNEKVFNKYKSGKIQQHSIGFQYIKLELAINDEESEKEFDFWNKYYDLVINKDRIDERGFFWVVSEIKLMEISAVLFGSNELTPTLDTRSDTSFQPSVIDTEEKPSEKLIEFDLDFAISQTKFFN